MAPSVWLMCINRDPKVEAYRMFRACVRCSLWSVSCAVFGLCHVQSSVVVMRGHGAHDLFDSQ